MSDHIPTSDSELRSRVRSLTDYNDNKDELTKSDLKDIVDQSKMDIEVETGISNFYSDISVTQILIYTTCINSKIQVENHSVRRFVLGDEIDVESRNATEDDLVQYQRWNRKIEKAMNSSDTVDEKSGLTLSNTSSYIGE